VVRPKTKRVLRSSWQTGIRLAVRLRDLARCSARTIGRPWPAEAPPWTPGCSCGRCLIRHGWVWWRHRPSRNRKRGATWASPPGTSDSDFCPDVLRPGGRQGAFLVLLSTPASSFVKRFLSFTRRQRGRGSGLDPRRAARTALSRAGSLEGPGAEEDCTGQPFVIARTRSRPGPCRTRGGRVSPSCQERIVASRGGGRPGRGDEQRLCVRPCPPTGAPP
jgi:hypothetical protein